MIHIAQITDPAPLLHERPRKFWTLVDENGTPLNRSGSVAVSDLEIPLYDTEIGAQIAADALNGPALTEDWEMSR